MIELPRTNVLLNSIRWERKRIPPVQGFARGGMGVGRRHTKSSMCRARRKRIEPGPQHSYLRDKLVKRGAYPENEDRHVVRDWEGQCKGEGTNARVFRWRQQFPLWVCATRSYEGGSITDESRLLP